MAKRAQTVSKTAEEAGEAIEEGVKDVAEDISDELSDGDSATRLRKSGAEFAEAAKDVGRDYAGKAREKGEKIAQRAKAGAGGLYEAGHDKADEAARYAGERFDDFSEIVRRHPAKSLGIAAGVGFLVGLIISRR